MKGEGGPPFRVKIKSYLRNTKTEVRLVAEGTGSLPFAPFPGLVLKFKGGFRVPFKGTTKVEWDGEEFFVETITFSVKTWEEELGYLRMWADAGFYVYWPYDRKAHIQRIAKNHTLHIVK